MFVSNSIHALILHSRALLIFLVLTLTMVSCEDTETGDLTDDRDAFLGTWNVTESCSKDAYTVQIQKDPSNSSQVIILNFWNTGNCDDPVQALVAGSSLYISTQKFCNNDFEADGSGDLTKDKVYWTYSVNDGADLFNCDATYTRP